MTADLAIPLSPHVLGVNIPVGEHVTSGPLNVDTIWTTLLAALVVIGVGLYVARRATSGTPSKIQILWEVIVSGVGDQVEQSLGPKYRRVVPLATAIFVLVLVADWVEILPGLFHNTDFAPSPSADVNLCYALGALVFVLTNIAGFKARGAKGYFANLVRKPRVMTPIHIIEEIAKPFSLALRLFGNIFAGGIMIALLLSFPIVFFPASLAFSVVWKLFDMFIGVIQAFIFALLTILYYQFATDTQAH